MDNAIIIYGILYELVTTSNIFSACRTECDLYHECHKRQESDINNAFCLSNPFWINSNDIAKRNRARTIFKKRGKPCKLLFLK